MHLKMLLATVLFDVFAISRAIDGIIWNSHEHKFIPIFNVTTFWIMKSEYLKASRELEHHNFRKEVLRIAYFQETNLVSFVDNDTKISGVFGELWNTLADYLNFTYVDVRREWAQRKMLYLKIAVLLVPLKLENRNFGIEFENGSYDGILGLIQQNKSQIVPRTGVFIGRLSLLDYTLPLWTIRYHLYIKPEWKHDEVWMFHLFSAKVWYTFFIFLIILSVVGYICEKHSVHSEPDDVSFDLQDHIFYTIAIASSQGCVPPEVHKNSRIIYISTSMFSWVVLIAFSSHAIYLMMNKKYILPFTGLKSLIRDSKYDVVAFSGSMVHEEFERTVSRYYKHARDFNRVSYASGAKDVFEKVCFSKTQKYAAFEAEDRHKAIGKNICRLIPTSSSYFDTWIASAIKRGFRYKRSFDIGILKMFECGIIDGLKDRWLDWKLEDNQEIPFQSIGIAQVYLIFILLFLGMVLSIFILLIEMLLFFRSKTSKKRHELVIIKRKIMEHDDKYVYYITRK